MQLRDNDRKRAEIHSHGAALKRMRKEQSIWVGNLFLHYMTNPNKKDSKISLASLLEIMWYFWYSGCTIRTVLQQTNHITATIVDWCNTFRSVYPSIIEQEPQFLGRDKTRSESTKVILVAGASTQEADICMAKPAETKKTSMNINYLGGGWKFWYRLWRFWSWRQRLLMGARCISIIDSGEVWES